MENIGLEMFKMWKSSWENYVKTLTMIQDKGEGMLDLVFSQSQTVHEDTKKLIKEGMAKAQEAQKSYLKAMDENLKNIEELLRQSS